MRNLVIWNVVVAAILGGLYGVLLQLVLGRGGVGRAALKTIAIIMLKRADDEHACWAARTMYHNLPRLPDESRRDLTRALFTS